MNIAIQTKNLILRRLVPKDYKAFALYYNHPEVAKWISVYEGDTSKATFEYNRQLETSYGIFLKDSDKLVGNIQFVNLANDFTADVGFILDSMHWGQGIMKEALMTALDYMFDVRGFCTIRAACDEKNIRSVKLLLSCGFAHEATLKNVSYIGGVANVAHFYKEGKKMKGEKKSQIELLEELGENSSLNEIQEYLKKVFELRGFSDKTIQQDMLHLCEEVGELSQALRRNPDGIKGEIADVFIILASIANQLGISIFDAFEGKEKVNAQRKWNKKDVE